ncbi:hypothetical protein RSSM_05139 [Rhodopirellula sallentina SM41]|uniref:Uncharacterized protein n=1 Tax=Rhodopirellula sallentina SM41 TaxID=1263870 RepID=M5TWL1_9BACT|nr:hypothetical protein RSSM_05139 [Rhodopirellula sallentina SM41]
MQIGHSSERAEQNEFSEIVCGGSNGLDRSSKTNDPSRIQILTG